MKKYSSIGELLKEYRDRNRISQQNLAAEFDVDVRTISRWEKNETLLKPDKEEEMVDITFIPYQVIRNLNAPISIPTYYDFELRKYSLSQASNELPDPQWLKSKMNLSTDRLRTISHSSDIEEIIRCTLYQTYITKPIHKELIKSAVALLPELNVILFDHSGYYSGHSVFFPLSLDTYNKIRDRTLKEEDLSEKDFVNIKNETDYVIYSYDINADCNENLYFISGEVLRFFKNLKNKNILFAGCTSRHDNYLINNHVRSTTVWEDKEFQEKFKSKAPLRLYEGTIKKIFK